MNNVPWSGEPPSPDGLACGSLVQTSAPPLVDIPLVPMGPVTSAGARSAPAPSASGLRTIMREPAAHCKGTQIPEEIHYNAPAACVRRQCARTPKGHCFVHSATLGLLWRPSARLLPQIGRRPEILVVRRQPVAKAVLGLSVLASTGRRPVVGYAPEGGGLGSATCVELCSFHRNVVAPGPANILPQRRCDSCRASAPAAHLAGLRDNAARNDIPVGPNQIRPTTKRWSSPLLAPNGHNVAIHCVPAQQSCHSTRLVAFAPPADRSPEARPTHNVN